MIELNGNLYDIQPLSEKESFWYQHLNNIFMEYSVLKRNDPTIDGWYINLDDQGKSYIMVTDRTTETNDEYASYELTEDDVFSFYSHHAYKEKNMLVRDMFINMFEMYGQEFKSEKKN